MRSIFFDGPYPVISMLIRELAKHISFDVTGKIEEADLVVVAGGDGTMMEAISTVANKGQFETPILGYNAGHLGFLSNDLEVKQLAHKIHYQEFPIQERDLLQVHLGNKKYFAINEVSIQPYKATGHLFEVSVEINDRDGRHSISYKGDGLIIATASGSTAYNLSANGPIVAPDLEVMVLSPLSPFSLASRPLVLPIKNVLAITIQENMAAVIDGKVYHELPVRDLITVTGSPNKAKIIKYSGFMESIQHKLGWNGNIRK